MMRLLFRVAPEGTAAGKNGLRVAVATNRVRDPRRGADLCDPHSAGLSRRIKAIQRHNLRGEQRRHSRA